MVALWPELQVLGMSVFVLHIGKHLGAGMALLGLFVKTVSSSVALPFPCTW